MPAMTMLHCGAKTRNNHGLQKKGHSGEILLDYPMESPADFNAVQAFQGPIIGIVLQSSSV